MIWFPDPNMILAFMGLKSEIFSITLEIFLLVAKIFALGLPLFYSVDSYYRDLIIV